MRRRSSLGPRQFSLKEEQRKELREQYLAESKRRLTGLQTEYKANIARLHELEAQSQPLKQKLLANMRQQLKHYYSLLYSAKDLRNTGLAWIIKTIWYLGGKLDNVHFPSVLDAESIKYLTDVSNSATLCSSRRWRSKRICCSNSSFPQNPAGPAPKPSTSASTPAFFPPPYQHPHSRRVGPPVYVMPRQVG